MKPITDEARDLLKSKGKSSARSRYQRGWIEETGEKVKKWKGHFYTYEIGTGGKERRVHRAVILGLKSEIRKGEATKKLQAIIDREANGKVAAPSADVTLEWFFTERCVPIWRQNWKASNAASMEYIIRRYAVEPFAKTPLGSIDRFALQIHANELAKTMSKSIVKKFVTWSRAIYDEAVDQDYLAKNPARRLTVPEARCEVRRVLTIDEVARLLGSLDGRDALILRMYLVLGLRARELFALRRDDLEADRIRIDESLDAHNVFHSPKTAASKSWLWMPEGLAADVWRWAGEVEDQSERAILFTARNGSPVRSELWRKRVLQVAARSVGMEGVTIHALRRTCATILKQDGDLKDVQSHLRHSRPDITADVYIAEIPEQVRVAVAALERRLRGNQAASE